MKNTILQGHILTELNRTLEPPVNFRTYYPGTCAFCAYLFRREDGVVECVRRDGPVFDKAGYLHSTCDTWKAG